MEENNKSYHQTISENRPPSIQHGIQHDHCTGAINNRHQIRMALHPPRMDQRHMSRSHHTQFLAQTRYHN
jgi:hypothetical protein